MFSVSVFLSFVPLLPLLLLGLELRLRPLEPMLLVLAQELVVMVLMLQLVVGVESFLLLAFLFPPSEQ